MAVEIKHFEELYSLLKDKELCDHSIGLLLGLQPNRPSRYLGKNASGLPMQPILSIYKHLTYKGEPVLLNYASEEDLYKAQEAFEGLIGDSPSCRSLGWYKGSEHFTLEVYDETKRLSD